MQKSDRHMGGDILRLLLTGTHRDDPYPLYRRLQETEPVHRTPFGLWLVTGHDEAVAGLRDVRLSSDLSGIVGNPRAFVSGGGVRAQTASALRTFTALAGYAGMSLGPTLPQLLRVGLRSIGSPDDVGAFAQLVSKALLLRDPPDHTRLRRLVSRAFTPRVVEGLGPRIEELVAQLLAKATADGQCDLMEAFAYPLPLTIICEMLGVPPHDQSRLIDWSKQLVVGLDPVRTMTSVAAARQADLAATNITDYLSSLASRRRTDPEDDLISRLTQTSDGDHEVLDDEEIVVMCALLLIAGHETTVNLIGNGLVALLRHPTAADQWRETPDLAPTAVDELLRYDSPVQTATRRALDDLELGGRHIPRGDIVMIVTGAANRDPRKFSQPDDLILDRQPNPHLAFGNGIHYCLGAALAHAEARIAVPALLAHRPKLLETPHWRPTMSIRGLRSLNIALSPCRT